MGRVYRSDHELLAGMVLRRQLSATFRRPAIEIRRIPRSGRSGLRSIIAYPGSGLLSLRPSGLFLLRHTRSLIRTRRLTGMSLEECEQTEEKKT
jgi:hypothetical protein